MDVESGWLLNPQSRVEDRGFKSEYRLAVVVRSFNKTLNPEQLSCASVLTIGCKGMCDSKEEDQREPGPDFVLRSNLKPS